MDNREFFNEIVSSHRHEEIMSTRDRFFRFCRTAGFSDRKALNEWQDLYQVVVFGVPLGIMWDAVYKDRKRKPCRVYDFPTNSVVGETVDLRDEIEWYYRNLSTRVVQDGHCVYLYGAPGTGKTYEACRILMATVRAQKVHGHHRLTSYYLTWQQTYQLCNDQKYGDPVPKQYARAVLHSDFLVIDEFSRPPEGDKKQARAFNELLRRRFAERLPTIIVGQSLTKKALGTDKVDLKLWLGKSTFRLLEERFRVFAIGDNRALRESLNLSWGS